MEQKSFDVIVIGGGPGGYPAAIRCAQNGKKVALIEAKDLGGTCLNRGCIPSKALIYAAETLHRIREAGELGIKVGSISIDFPKMVDRKEGIVNKIRSGLTGLIASNQITVFRGLGKFISPNEVKVMGTDNVVLTAKNIIIATGSEPRNMTSFPFDGERILDSTAIMEMKHLPESLAIVGGGVIGCEFASLFSLLGVKVTVIELLPRLLPMEDPSISETLEKAFQKRGITIETSASVAKIDRDPSGITVSLSNGKNFSADIALIAVGRSLNTNNIGLDKAGVIVNDNGFIPVDERMQTNVPGIYAIGDIASKWLLAHVATHQGIVAADNATGHPCVMRYDAVPSVIFTYPEIATVGMSLDQAKTRGYDATLSTFPFQALGKSQATMQTEGFAQIVVDKHTGQILGAQVVGHEAATLIAEMAVAIANELTVECITETIHAHPTIAEAWMEAAFIGSDRPLHIPPKKKQPVLAKSR